MRDLEKMGSMTSEYVSVFYEVAIPVISHAAPLSGAVSMEIRLSAERLKLI